MLKKLLLVVLALFVFLAVDSGFAAVSVGVKAGDWIEYRVYTTGAAEVGHDVVWARIEVLTVSGSEVTVNTTTKAINGTYSSVVMTLNPAVGNVDVWAIIPVDLSAGDSFFDKNFGDIPIEGEEQKTYGGTNRDTTFYNSSERFKRWDKATGVFLEGTDKLEDYSLTAVFDRTNMWGTQNSAEPAMYSVVFLVLVVFVVGAVAVLVRRSQLKLDGLG